MTPRGILGYFFEFVPAAQKALESRRSHCFFTMSSSNRWTRASAAEAQAKASSSSRRQDFPDSQYDDEVRHSSPPGGYAQRRIKETPSEDKRTPLTLPSEDHMAFSAGYRYETAWFQARERLRKKRERNKHIPMGPNNMSGFDRHQMFMDVISWILYWGSEHREFDVAIKWLAEFLKHLCGFTTQDEEDWLDEQCSSYYIDLAGRRRDSRYLACSKSLSLGLRHNKRTYLFSERGSMNIADLLDQMDWQNPKQYNMSGAQFAAFLLCNPKQRFFVDIHMQCEWYPNSSAATYPFDVRLGCVQAHSNQVVGPYSAHHPLTFDEAMCLGWIFHVTDSANTTSIQQLGLKTDQCERKWTRWKRRSSLHVPQRQWSGLHKDGRRHCSPTPLQAASVLRVGFRIHQEPTAFPYKERCDFISL